MAKPFWDDSYKRKGKIDTFNNGKPASDVVFVSSKLSKGAKVLDLGCGEGRNSFYLAQLGFEVVAVDISQSGIDKVREISKELGLEITSFVCDIRDFDFSDDYDLIISHSCLQYISRDEWKLVIEQMKKSTKVLGFNVVDVFTDEIPEPENQKGLTGDLFKKGELGQLYSDWQKIDYKSYIIEHSHPGVLMHKHSGENIIVQKLN